jgi:hypothetical protein
MSAAMEHCMLLCGWKARSQCPSSDSLAGDKASIRIVHVRRTVYDSLLSLTGSNVDIVSRK